MLPPWKVARSHVALAIRDDASPEHVAELRRAYHAARAKQALCDLLASDLPPTPEQRLELASILVGGAAGAAAA